MLIKNQKGISMVTVVITIITILILASVAFVSSFNTIEKTNYSKYTTNVSQVKMAFEETSVNVKGQKIQENKKKDMVQIYNYIAKNGNKEEDFVKLENVPKYTIIENNGQLGFELPKIMTESGTEKKVLLKYATTEKGTIFTWPPIEYDNKLWITDKDTVEDKMQTQIKIGDEVFQIKIDSEDGSLLDWPLNSSEENPDDEGNEIPSEHEHAFYSKVQTEEYFCSEATCVLAKQYYYKCMSCDAKGSQTYTVGTPLGHLWGEENLVREANCSQKGIIQSKCSRCESTKNIDIPINLENHHGGELEEITKEPTCQEEGEKIYKCASCNFVIGTSSIPIVEHNMDEVEITKVLTCTENGVKTYRCSGCHKVMQIEEADALGHDWNAPEAPRKCNRCNLEEKLANITYNIVYKSISGINLGTATVEKLYGTTNEIIAPEKNGYDTPASQNIAWDSIEAKTITFTYKPIEYDITFILNNGSGVPNRTYTVETETFTIGTPEKEGYTFVGWTGDNGTIPQATVSIEKGSTGDKKYTANWSDTVYNITIDCNGGTGVYNRTYTIESSTFTLGIPIRNGYTFTGWTGSNGTTPQTSVSITKGTKGDKNYKANWSIINYTITYDLKGGTVSNSNPTEYNIETETFTLNKPTKTGSTFAGWTGSNNSTPETSVRIEKGSTGSRNYVANWTVNGYEYNVVYKSTSGIELGKTTVSKEYGTTNEITAPEIVGYDTPVSQMITWDSVTAKTITFIYKPISYSITIGCNGGTGVSSTTYTIETPTFTIGTPKKEGCTFIGWTGSNGSVPQATLIIEQGSIGARNYAANWDAIIYNIIFNLAGGTGVSNRTYTVDTETFTLGTPTKTGYTFTGWTGSNGNTPQTSVRITKGSTGNKTYTANYEANKYYVKYNANNGSGTMSNSTHVYDTEKALTENAFTRTGYTFNGWNTKANGTGTSYANKASVKNLTSTSGGTVNLYAQWKINGYTYNVVYKSTTEKEIGRTTATYNFGTTNIITAPDMTGYTTPASQSIAWDSTTAKTITFIYTPISYTISYTLNGGTVATANPTSYTIETATFTLNNPDKAGYTFTGWTGSNGSTLQKSVSIASGSTENKSYIANWSANTYSVTYDANGGTGAPGKQNFVFASQTPISTTVPNRNGYRFSHWEATHDGTKMDPGDKIPSGWGSFILKAQWIPISYTITYNLNDGTVSGNPTSYNIETTTFTLNNPTKEGYTFTGWTGSNGTTPQTSVSITKGSIGNKSYIANWSLATYTNAINHVVYGGDPYAEVIFTSTTFNQQYKSTITFGSSLATTAPNGTKLSHFGTADFAGTWTGYYAGETVVQPNKGVVMNAYYSPITYNITYNMNGGTNHSSNPATYNVMNGVTLSNPTKPGYNFAGWTNANGTQVTGINPGATSSFTSGSDLVTKLASRTTGNQTLTANWTPISYSITYNLDGGTVSGNPTTYTSETATITLNNPTKDGYTFIGWTGTDLTSATKTVSIAKGSTGNRTYTANWQQNVVNYKATFYGNESNYTGGYGYLVDQFKVKDVDESSVANPITGSTITMPAGPTATGNGGMFIKWTFVGWSTDPTASGQNPTCYKPGEQVKITKDTDFYALWYYTSTTTGSSTWYNP